MEHYFNEIIRQAQEKNASDIMMRSGEKLYFRVHNSLEEQKEVIKEELLNWLYTLKGANFIREGPAEDIDFAYEGVSRLRVHLFLAQGKPSSCIRLIKKEVPPLKDLGIPEDLAGQIMAHKGISLVTGKTGSGKSTTLASILEEILRRCPWHVITLEDPVEYPIHPGKGFVTQRELGHDFPSFGQGIRSALRESPDLLMVGEIRDGQSLQAALSAAESGCGVIATLHSLGAKGTVQRILQMTSAQERDLVNFQLGSNLTFIISQRLIRQSDPPALFLDYELLLGTTAVKNTILSKDLAQLSSIIELSSRQGMRRFRQI